ncbi:MAG: hypothetical protein ACI9CF_001606 [Candidatus Omnitrophota bacterium]|jgi:hypothetical protein
MKIKIKCLTITLLISCLAVSVTYPVWANEVDDLKAQIKRLRQKQSDNFNEYQERIDASAKKVLEMQGVLPTWIENSSKASKGFIDFNWYYDIEKYSVMTVNIAATLPNNISYFSLNNFFNDFNDSDYTDFEDFYSEQNLTWAPPETRPIAWNIQWNLRSPDNNDRLRLAPQWRIHETPYLDKILGALNMTYKINFHAVQWDDETHGDYVWQMEHVYRVNVFPGWFDNRVYISGFADHTFGGPNNPALVTEHQLGVRVLDNWYAIAEYRRNEYRKGNEDSLGVGIEYKVVFN